MQSHNASVIYPCLHRLRSDLRRAATPRSGIVGINEPLHLLELFLWRCVV